MTSADRSIFYWPLYLSILFYRKSISPRKGFRCAHNAVHGEGSCSDYFLARLEDCGFVELLSEMKLRLAACKAAAAVCSIDHANDENALAHDAQAIRSKKDCGGACALLGSEGVAACLSQ
ncbi:MAG: membrane protein insertion efficiency factor YidD [Parvularculaceae bacterium]